ncbi:MAG: type VI secretion system baseplate subunit TssF, partial [Burkholderiaceae bacterium]|nr:type VI secretion system baseplate subunit TssF [Burkholderiaceae bacterium]
IPLALAGLSEDEALIPFPPRSQPAFRLLAEYFTYPEKFHFIDLDWAPLRAALPAGCRRFTLHLALKGWRGDSDEARMLGGLSSANLLTGCTPVVNLFSKPGVPIALAHTGADIPLRADAAHTFAYEIHTIESVELVRKVQGEQLVTPFQPLYSSRHGAANKGNYWLARRDEALACVSPGHELSITLIDPEFTPTDAARATLSTMLTCTNRDLPGALRFGKPEGDLRCHQVPDDQPIRLLRKPSAPCRFGAGEAHWRLIAHLSLNHSGLTNAGLGEFQRMLSLYDLPRSAISQRQINGVTGLEHGIARMRIGSGARAALMPGIAIRMRIDEQAFAGASVVVFAQVIERYFALHRQLNCFTQLTIVSDKSGEELIACPPRTAESPRA